VRSPLISAAVAAAAVIALAPCTSASAADDIGNVVCNGGSVNVLFNPGVKFSKNAVRLAVSGDMGICRSANHPRITGGTIRIAASFTAACPGPLGPGYAKVTVDWNDGSKTVIDQSVFRGDAQTFSLEGGYIGTGRFANGTARANGRTTSNLVELGAGCASSDGMTGYSATIDEFAVGEI
jgi:hypothetical protein